MHSLILNREYSVLQDVLNIAGLTYEVKVLALEDRGITLKHLLVLVLDLRVSGAREQVGDMRVLGDAILQLTSGVEVALVRRDECGQYCTHMM